MSSHDVGFYNAGESGPKASPLDVFDPRSRFLCAFALSLAFSFVSSLPAILVSAIVPAALLFLGDRASMLQTLKRVNIAGLFICLLLPLTYRGERYWGVISVDGMIMALLVLYRLNIITVVMQRLVAALGIGRIHDVLAALGAPEKLRILLLLTIRHIWLLMDRSLTVQRAVSVRAPKLSWRLASVAFACGVGTAMIHSQDRAERSLLAIYSRGGFKGFSQYSSMSWHLRDTLLCALCLLCVLCICFSAALPSMGGVFIAR